jgi:hypothetical protein
MPKKVLSKAAAPKKVVTKKSPAKVKKTELKTLVYASDSKSFWLSNGLILNSLVALEAALNEMDKVVFSHHVTKDKNDFADWVEQVLGDSDCAEALRKSKTEKSAHSCLVKVLKTYQI